MEYCEGGDLHAKLTATAQEGRLLEASHTLRSAEEAHVRQLVLTGVLATKHGRKGKPHPRHVRCVGARIEWARADEQQRHGRYEKAISVDEIETIQGGMATDVARRDRFVRRRYRQRFLQNFL